MKLLLFQIDAFSRQVFGGNPAAVIPLHRWISDEAMQNIATENNLSETAFFVGRNGEYHIRWFTPTVEVDFCGHATLAAAWLIFNKFEPSLQELKFDSRTGELSAQRRDEAVILNFPVQAPTPCEAPQQLLDALPIDIEDVQQAEDYLVVCKSAEQVQHLKPDLRLLKQIPLRAVIVTAPGDDVDFVSRVFGPKVGIDEDPATGSAHTTLTPYWAQRLDKNKLKATQLSKRGAEFLCELKGGRVLITGYCAEYMSAQIFLND